MHNAISQIITDAAQRFGDKTALIIEEQTFTYERLEALSNQVANSLVSSGVSKVCIRSNSE